MKNISGIRLAVLLHSFSLLWLSTTPAHAGTPIHGAKAGAMQAAFVAVADDPSAIVHNPAGITHLKGNHFYTGVTAVMGDTELETPSGQTEKSDFKVYFPPHAYAASDFGIENMAFGIGFYSPFGIGGREWREEGLTRYLATKNLISTLALNPVFAYRIMPQVSLGIGAFYLYASNEFERMIDQSALGASDGKFSLEGDGGGFGYNLGVLLFPGQRISFGMAYRSKVDVDQDLDIRLTNMAPALQPLTGGSNPKFAADTDLEFPEVFNFGLAFRPMEALTLALECEWTGWSSFERMAVDLRQEVPQAGITDFAMDFDYKDTWIYKIGVAYELNANYCLRAGYAYVENPVPTRTVNPANPDADQHSLSVGLGYRAATWYLDFFYMADIFKDRSFNNELLKGKFKTFAHFVGCSVGFVF
ncbi:MAG: hypothetical protein VR64_02775 [Desulfatitalea sp. BRH_c12]|nr:MAG: hypothetical protein VR64_02775 [Desulfatitalea sp. BRH_c12]